MLLLLLVASTTITLPTVTIFRRKSGCTFRLMLIEAFNFFLSPKSDQHQISPGNINAL